jgi:hypothetical protein
MALTGDEDLRDIAEDIQKRVDLFARELEALIQNRTELERQIRSKQAQLEAARRLYDFEKARLEQYAQMRLPLSRFTRMSIAEAAATLVAEHAGITVAEIRERLEREGYPFRTVPGRAIHMALVGLQSRGAVTKGPDGKWRAAAAGTR